MNKEQIFDQAARAYMAKFSLPDFKMTHPRLFKAIMEAMDNMNQPPKSAGVKEPETYLDEMPSFDIHPSITYEKSEVRKALTAQAKDFEAKMEAKILDFSKELTALILTPPFRLEHSQHAIACEKIAELRNRYRSQFISESNSCPPVRTPAVKLYCVCGCGAIRPGEPCRENGRAFENCPECETPTLCDGVKCIKR